LGILVTSLLPFTHQWLFIGFAHFITQRSTDVIVFVGLYGLSDAFDVVYGPKTGWNLALFADKLEIIIVERGKLFKDALPLQWVTQVAVVSFFSKKLALMMLVALLIITVTEVDVTEELDRFANRTLLFPSTLRILLLARRQCRFTVLLESFLEVKNEVSVLAVGLQMRQILIVVERDTLVEP